MRAAEPNSGDGGIRTHARFLPSAGQRSDAFVLHTALKPALGGSPEMGSMTTRPSAPARARSSWTGPEARA